LVDADGIARGLGKGDEFDEILDNKEYAKRFLNDDFCLNKLRRRNEAEIVISNAKTIEQSVTHRCIYLIDAAITQIEDQNSYALALILRGHMESVALMGYFCHQLNALINGSVSMSSVREKLFSAMMGSSHGDIPNAPCPINVLKCIDRSDLVLARLAKKKGSAILRDEYEWISNFCHPNFLSFQIMIPEAIHGNYASAKEKTLAEPNTYLISSLRQSTRVQRLFSDHFLELRERTAKKITQA